MNIAELFVNLGIKGAEKTVGALGNVRKGLGSITSTSLETKAGILGVMYGFEQMMSISGKTGTNLENLATNLGVGRKELQQWQYATRQAGGSSEELDSTIANLSKSMAGVNLNKGLPEGLALLSQAAGGIDFSQKDDPFYMMRAIEKGVKAMGNSPKGKAIANYLAGSLGVSGNVLAGMRRGKYSEEVLKRAPTYSDKEIGQLDKANIGWGNLGNSIEMAFGHFNAKHGVGLVGDISKLVPKVLSLANAFTKMAEHLGVFQKIGKVFEGWGIIFGLITEGADKLTKFADSQDKEKDLKDGTGNFFSSMMEAWKGMKIQDDEQKKFHEMYGWGAKFPAGIGPAPWERPGFKGVNQDTGQTVFNQTITHHGDAKDTKSVGDTHKTAVGHAYRQRQQGQGN